MSQNSISPTESPAEISEKLRAQKLRQVLDKAVQSTLKGASLHKFLKCFPELSKSDPSTLESCYSQVIGFWRDSCTNEFQKISKERDLVRKLNSLDDLVSEAKIRQKTNTPPLVSYEDLEPEQACRSYWAKLSQDEIKSLSSEVEDLEKEFGELQTQIIDLNTQNQEVLFKSQSSLNLLLDTTNSLDSQSIDESIVQTASIISET